MAGTLPALSMGQRLDPRSGDLLGGGRLYFIQAGTTSTPQNAYQDYGLTIPHPNPIILDAGGNIPPFYLGDGFIKIRLTAEDGVEILVADQLLVVGPSDGGGGGGGGGVDPTTVLTTGDIKISYGNSSLAGFVRANGRSIGSSTSGATERANADAQALFEYLWLTDTNLAVSGGRGASAAADWAANKTITLPDARGRTIAGLDDMGNSAAGRLTTATITAGGTVLGASGGAQNVSIAQNQLPNVVPVFAGTTESVVVTADQSIPAPSGISTAGTSGSIFIGTSATRIVSRGDFTPHGNISSINGNVTQQATSTVQPTILATVYIKL